MPEHRCDPYDLEWSGRPVVNRCEATCCGRVWELDLSGSVPRWVQAGMTERPRYRPRAATSRYDPI